MFFGSKSKGIDQAEAERLAHVVINGIKKIIAAGASETLAPGKNDTYAAIHGKWYDQVLKDLTAAGFRDLGTHVTVTPPPPAPEKSPYYRFALSDDGLIVASWFKMAWDPPRGCVILHSYRADDSACMTTSGITPSGVAIHPDSDYRLLPENAPISGMVKLHRRDLEKTNNNYLKMTGMDDILAARKRNALHTQRWREAQGIALCEPYLRHQFKEKYEERGAPAVAVIMANKEWWDGEKSAADKAAEEARRLDNGRSGPYDITARFYHHVEPVDRGTWYEEPLQAALDAAKVGTITGGGSQLNAKGGIEFADIEIEVPDRHESLRMVADALERAGAPQGSELRWGDDVQLEFGKTQCLAVFLDGVNLPDEVYAALDFEALLKQLEGAAGAGSHRGIAQGNEETGLFFFGPDAEAMFQKVEPVLKALPIGQNARIVVRHGKQTLNPRTVRL